MVNPLEILPVLLMVLAIVCIPLLGEGAARALRQISPALIAELRAEVTSLRQKRPRPKPT